MKTYIQITGGRGPIECARADALKLSALTDAKKAEQDRKIWMNHNTLERGNPKKIFKGNL